MSGAATDRLLAVLLVALFATGLLTLRAGAPASGWLFVAHGLLAGTLLTTVVLKLRRSVPRAASGHRWRHLALGLVLAIGAVGSVAAGFIWAAAGRFVHVGPFSLLTLHVLIGLVVVPVIAVHLVPRRWRLLRPGQRVTASVRRGVSRRSVLVAGGLGLASAAMWSAVQVIDRLGGGERRFTGSRWLPAGGIPPPTTFLGDTVPAIDPDGWRLKVTGQVGRPRTYDMAALRALGETDLAAVLDCTGGWALETSWSGVPLGVVLDRSQPGPGASQVDVRSATGWGARLGLGEARACLLATGVAGGALPIANGAPCRLVVPDRRGLDWVKWVDRIEVA